MSKLPYPNHWDCQCCENWDDVNGCWADARSPLTCGHIDEDEPELEEPDELEDMRKCRVCGCTDLNCRQCIEAQGFPCSWVEDDLCSRCVKKPNPYIEFYGGGGV